MTLDAHLSKLVGYLQRFRDTGILNRIDGADRPGAGGTFTTISPVDKSHIADVARGTAEDIDKAAKAAHDAFGDWRDMAAKDRKAILIRIAEGIEARVCVTAQHRQMLDQVLEVFGLQPDHDLDLMTAGQGLGELFGRVLTALDPVLEAEQPDMFD